MLTRTSKPDKACARKNARRRGACQSLCPLCYPSFEDTNSNEIIHNVIEPFAKAENIKIFKDLQKLQSVGLVVPVDENFMYFAAMNSKSCKLTALGYHYWRLAKDKRLY